MSYKILNKSPKQATHTLFQETKKLMKNCIFVFFPPQFSFWQQGWGWGHSALHLSGSDKSEARCYLHCFNWSQTWNHCASFSNSHIAPLTWAEMPSMEKPLNSYALKLRLKLKKRKAECQELLWANDKQASPPRLVYSVLNRAILLAMRALTDGFDSIVS